MGFCGATVTLRLVGWGRAPVMRLEVSTLNEVNDETGSVDLVYEEIRARLKDQASQLEQLRNRGGSIVAVGAVAVSFLGGSILDSDGGAAWPFWAAVVLFVVVVLIGLSIMFPREVWWLLHPAPADLLRHYIDLPEVDAKRYLAEYMSQWVLENEEKLLPLYRRTQAAVLMTGASVVLLVIDLGAL